MVMGVNQPAPANVVIPIQQQQAPVQQEEPGCLRKIGNGIVKVWNVVWEKGCLAAQVTTAIFFRCISWISPTLADKLEALWGHVNAIYLRIRAALREEELLGDIQGLRERNRALDVRVQELVDQSDGLRIVNDRLTWEKNQVVAERDHLIGERQELILGQAPILIERDHLREERQQLTGERDVARNQNELLTGERNEAVEARRVQDGAYHRALEELGELRVRLDQVGDYRELNQHLTRFHEMYVQIAQNGNGGATQLALEILIPQYKAHRARLHEMLQIAINGLPENDLGRIPLRGILRLSQEEMEHVEKISQTLHLFGELRQPLAQYFQAPAPVIQAVEVI
jgi:FtsZ-binding cell division protein ZapB